MILKNKKFTYILSGVIGLFFTGCVNTETLKPNTMAVLEAKDRGIYSFKKEIFIPGKTTIQKDKKRKTTTRTTEGKYVELNFVCTDYGSDVVTINTSQTSLDATFLKKAFGASHSNAEGATTIGVRTAGTDAILKMMSENCKVYAGGGLTPLGMEALQRRYQTTLATILAVEQLTGVVAAPAVNLTSSSSVGSAEQLSKLADLIVKENSSVLILNNSISKSEKEFSELKEALDEKYKPEDIKVIIEAGENRTPEQDKIYKEYLTEKEPFDNKNKELESLKSSLSIKEDSLKTLSDTSSKIKLSGHTTTNGDIQIINNAKSLSNETVQHVADKVALMIESLNGQGYYREICATILLANPTFEVSKEVKKGEKTTVIADCMNFFRKNPHSFTEQ